MSEHQLQIILKMRDEASKKIEQFSQKVENEMKRAGDAMVKFGREISKIGKDMSMIGASIVVPMAAAFKTTSQYSVEAAEVLKRLDDSAKAFQITIGTALLPVVEKVSNVIAALTKWFEQLDPKLRDAILQGALMAGIFLTLGGAITYLIGKVADLGGHLLKFAAVHPTLTLISIALVIMIKNWEKLREVVLPLLGLIEAGATAITIALIKMADAGILYLIEKFGWLVDAAKVFIEIAARIGQIPRGIADMWKTQLDALKENIVQVRDGAQDAIDKLQQNLTRCMETGKGAVTDFVDSGITNLNKFIESFTNAMGPESNGALQNFIQNFQQVWTQAYEQAVNLGQQTGQIFVNSIKQLSSGIGTAVSDMIFKGKNFGESMKQVALQMAQTFVASIVQMIAQFLIFQATQAAFFPLMVAMGAAAASALGAIWAPVAAMVSLATMGANAGPAAAAIASTVALAHASVIPMAEGGTGIVDRPTLFLAGERGRERYSFEPMSRTNSQGRSPGNTMTNYITVKIEGPVIKDDMDINVVAEKVSHILALEIDRLH